MSRSEALPPEQQSGKAAFKALGKAFGGQTAVEAEFGIDQRRVSDMGLANVAVFPTLDLIDGLEDRTVDHPGWPHVTRWLARRRGFALVKLPEGMPDKTGISERLIRMTRELGDVATVVSDGIHPASEEGEEFSLAEAEAALAEALQLQEETAGFVATLHAIVTEKRR